MGAKAPAHLLAVSGQSGRTEVGGRLRNRHEQAGCPLNFPLAFRSITSFPRAVLISRLCFSAELSTKPALAAMGANDPRKSWLPIDVLSHTFSYLTSPIDLYRASLVDRQWRAAAIDSRLWEAYYWVFYRIRLWSQDREEILLYARRKASRYHAMRAWVQRAANANGLSQISYPPFLLGDRGGDSHSALDFHDLFIRRINADERLLWDLRAIADLDCHILDHLLDVAQRYGDKGRDLLIAICADQQLTQRSLGFLTRAAGSDGSHDRRWPRAIEVHARVAAGCSEPHVHYCISLHRMAQQVLGLLQRRQALRAIQSLQGRFSTIPALQTLKQRVQESAEGIEEAFQSLALFRYGEPGETEDYLDLLALYVWADVNAIATTGRHTSAHDYPLGSTRSLLLRIVASLHRLGFRGVDKGASSSIELLFFHVQTLRPPQHHSAMILAAILCAVCRRLGVAATLVNAPGSGLVTVIEEGKQPESWSGDEHSWKSFYFVPVRRPPYRWICEDQHLVEFVDSLKVDASAAGLTVSSGMDDFQQPASPLAVLDKAADVILLLLSQQGATQAYRARASRDEIHSTPSRQDNELSRLGDYLCGRSPSPPRPLESVTLPSSLALFQPSTAGSSSGLSLALRQEARHCALWLTRLIAPNTLRPPGQADKLLQGSIRSHFGCDIALLLELHGCRVETELRAARGGLAMAGYADGAVRDEGEFVDGPDPPEGVGDLLVTLRSADARPNRGELGGLGGCEPGKREGALLNPAHPSNALRVKHRVETLFIHREHGLHGVVIGWDSSFKPRNLSVAAVGMAV